MPFDLTHIELRLKMQEDEAKELEDWHRKHFPVTSQDLEGFGADVEAVLNNYFIKKILLLMAHYECSEEIMWHSDLRFYVLCNDVFAWGVADCEEITIDTLDQLCQAYEDSDEYGAALYCARIRKIRPQGAWHEKVKSPDILLFDQCGPIRIVDPGNPVKYP